MWRLSCACWTCAERRWVLLLLFFAHVILAQRLLWQRVQEPLWWPLLAGWLLLRLGQAGQHDHATRIYLDLLRELAVCGLPRQRGEAPGDYCRRVTLLRPEYAQALQQVTAQFEAIAYKRNSRSAPPGDSTAAQLKALENTSWQLRRRLLSPWRRLLVSLGLAS